VKQIQTVITVPLNIREQVIIRLEGVHVGPFAVHADFQQSVGGMSPMAHDVRHESWDDGE
jgi:hypothetical protein